MPISPRFSPNAVRVIDVLTYPAVQLLDVRLRQRAGAGGERPYVLRVVAQGGEGVTASAGVALAAGPLTQLGEALDTLLVAGGEGAEAAAENPVLIEWVRERAAQARGIGGSCMRYSLAQATFAASMGGRAALASSVALLFCTPNGACRL